MKNDGATGSAKKKSRKPVGNLPPGVCIYNVENGTGGKFWRVRLNKKFTGGKVVIKNFPNLDEARDWIFGDAAKTGNGEVAQLQVVQHGQTELKKQFGAAAFGITPAQVTEAQDAFRRLDAVDRTLTEAVDYYFRHALPVGGTRTFSEVETEFIQHRRSFKDCKPRTIVQYESYFKVIKEELGDVKINDLKRSDIEDWLSETEWSPRTRKNYLVTLTTIFNYAVKRDYCAENPAAIIERPIMDDKAPGILTPGQTKILLDKTLACRREMLAPIAIGLFAGLRRSELCSLDWSEIDLESKTIVVEGTKAKTRKRRVVTITDNLLAWLKPLVLNEGRVAPNVDAFGEKLKHLASDAEISPWPHNALRHSFGSYFYAESKNENLTAAEMGNTPQMIFKHYRALVRPVQVALYWKILPPADYTKRLQTTKPEESK